MTSFVELWYLPLATDWRVKCTFSNSIEVSIPRALCRRWRSWKISWCSNMGLLIRPSFSILFC